MIHRAAPRGDAGRAARRRQGAWSVVGVDQNLSKRDRTAIRRAVVAPLHHQPVSRNRTGFEILEFPEGRRWNRVLRQVDFDVRGECPRADGIDVENDLAGPVRKIKRLPDHVGVVAVVLYGDRGHELSRQGRAWIANERVVGRIDARRGEGGPAAWNWRRDDRVCHGSKSREVRRREPCCAPFRRIQIAASSPNGGRSLIERVAERRVREAARCGRCPSWCRPEQRSRANKAEHERHESRDRAAALSHAHRRDHGVAASLPVHAGTTLR